MDRAWGDLNASLPSPRAIVASRQPNRAAVGQYPDFRRGRNLWQAGHGHDIAANGHDEPRARRYPQFVDRDAEAMGHAGQFRVVGKSKSTPSAPYMERATAESFDSSD